MNNPAMNTASPILAPTAGLSWNNEFSASLQRNQNYAVIAVGGTGVRFHRVEGNLHRCEAVARQGPTPLPWVPWRSTCPDTC